jgi:hypothetical protein
MADSPRRAHWQPALDLVLAKGPLGRRMLHAAGNTPSRAALAKLYTQLCLCLENDKAFDPAGYP